jgi:hypothetical protein
MQPAARVRLFVFVVLVVLVTFGLIGATAL